MRPVSQVAGLLMAAERRGISDEIPTTPSADITSGFLLHLGNVALQEETPRSCTPLILTGNFLCAVRVLNITLACVQVSRNRREAPAPQCV
jgi:hypothetical protein